MRMLAMMLDRTRGARFCPSSDVETRGDWRRRGIFGLLDAFGRRVAGSVLARVDLVTDAGRVRRVYRLRL